MWLIPIQRNDDTPGSPSLQPFIALFEKLLLKVCYWYSVNIFLNSPCILFGTKQVMPQLKSTKSISYCSHKLSIILLHISLGMGFKNAWDLKIKVRAL